MDYGALSDVNVVLARSTESSHFEYKPSKPMTEIRDQGNESSPK